MFRTGASASRADNGVPILVGVDARAMRIEVGYGLEGVLPDGLAGAIIREAFLPRFRDDDYAGGIVAGTRRVAEVITRNDIVSPEQRAALDAANAAPEPPGVVAVVMLGLFVGLGAFMLGSGIGARIVSSVFSGTFVTGMSGWFSLLALPPPYLIGMAIYAVSVFIAGVVLGRNETWRRRLRGKRHGASRGWVMEGGGSSGGGSSSSGFGGGRSGGGGASGRW
ncbi:MAG: TPM domain-containing protein [Vicinamibacterales bacterium]